LKSTGSSNNKNKHRRSISLVKVDSGNINNVKLDEHISSLYSVGPVFEGFPRMKFSGKESSWQGIASDICNYYAPKLPFRYFSEEKARIYEDRAESKLKEWNGIKK